MHLDALPYTLYWQPLMNLMPCKHPQLFFCSSMFGPTGYNLSHHDCNKRNERVSSALAHKRLCYLIKSNRFAIPSALSGTTGTAMVVLQQPVQEKYSKQRANDDNVQCLLASWSNASVGPGPWPFDCVLYHPKSQLAASRGTNKCDFALRRISACGRNR